MIKGATPLQITTKTNFLRRMEDNPRSLIFTLQSLCYYVITVLSAFKAMHILTGAKTLSQKQSIITALANLLNKYSDATILSEQLQNADDAKANCLTILLETKANYGVESLIRNPAYGDRDPYLSLPKEFMREDKIPRSASRIYHGPTWSLTLFYQIWRSNQQTRTRSRFIEVLNYIAPHFGSFTALPAAIAERSLPLPGTSTLAEFNKIYYSILGKIGAIKDLGVANIVKTINQLPTIIPETDMTSLVDLFVRLVSTTGFDITTCGLKHLITEDGTLQPCNKVYCIGKVIEIDDISDIDGSKVFFIHPSLLELVGRLRLDDIHESVTFTLDRKESSILSPPYPREFQTIISTIESPIFRESQFKIVPAHVAKLALTFVESEFEAFKTMHILTGAKTLSQKQSIITALANLLNKYSDATILSEQLQNADDAKANCLTILLETKADYGVESLIRNPAYGDRDPSPLQGAALYIYNDSVFEDKDWEGISKFGDGSKRHDLRSVGKFGLGFNSVYHLTDCPMVLSGSKIFIPDVRECHFPPVGNNSDPGILLDIEQEHLDAYPDQFAPFRKFGNKMDGQFRGTIFRLPLRSTLDSDIKPNTICTPDQVRHLLQGFVDQAPNLLLFIKNIRDLKIMVDTDELLHVNISEASHRERSLVIGQMNGFVDKIIDKIPQDLVKWNRLNKFKTLLADSRDPPVVHYPLDIEIKTPAYHRSDLWLVTQGVYWDKEVSKIMLDKSLEHEKLIPIAGVASPRPNTDGQVAAHQQRVNGFNGRPFCFLPIGNLKTNLPVHINGYFVLSDSRTDINLSNVAKEFKKEHCLTEWNRILLKVSISHLYASNMLKLTSYFQHNTKSKSSLYALFPFHKPLEPKIEDHVISSTLELLVQSKVFFNHFKPAVNQWSTLSHFHLLNGQPEPVKTVLSERNISSVLLPNDLFKLLKDDATLKKHCNLVSNTYVCQLLRDNPLTKASPQLLQILLNDIKLVESRGLNGVAIFPTVGGQSLLALVSVDAYFDISSYYYYPSSVQGDLQVSILKEKKGDRIFDVTDIQGHLERLKKHYVNIRELLFIDFLKLAKDAYPLTKSASSDDIGRMGLSVDRLWEYINSLVTPKNSEDLRRLLSGWHIIPSNGHGSMSYAIDNTKLFPDTTQELLKYYGVLNVLGFHIVSKVVTCSDKLFVVHPCEVVISQLSPASITALTADNISMVLNFAEHYISTLKTNRSLYDRFKELPVFPLFPNPAGEKTPIINMEGINREIFIDRTMTKTFAQINLDHILPNLAQYPTKARHLSVQHVIEKTGQYLPEKLMPLKFVPTMVPDEYEKPGLLYWLNDDTKILQSYPGGARMLLSQSYTAKEVSHCIAGTAWVPTKSGKFELPRDCCTSAYAKVCHTIKPIANIDHSRLKKPILDLFSAPAVKDVLEHLLNIAGGHSTSQMNPGREESQVVVEIEPIYSYFVDSITTRDPDTRTRNEKTIKNCLAKDGVKWILINNRFVECKSVALSGVDIFPYLSVIPQLHAYRFKTLFQLFNIPQEFGLDNFVHTVKQIQLDVGTAKMTSEQQDIILKALDSISVTSASTLLSLEYLPTEDGYLHPRDRVLSKEQKDRWIPFLDKKGFKLITSGIKLKTVLDLKIKRVQQILQQGKDNHIFGQEEQLPVKIRSLLIGYDSHSLLKEMLQNAEDSGATTLSVMLDERSFVKPADEYSISLKDCPDYVRLFMPSIVIHNDKPFTEADIVNVQSLGDSNKMAKDGSTIGKFGYGINSMYNISDSPMFVTNSSLYVFDPLKTHFDYLPHDRCGKCFDLDDEFQQETLEPFRHYDYFGLDIDQPSYDGTLFRFPMRTTRSDKSLASWTSKQAESLIQSFIEEAERCLVFMCSVKKIKILKWKAGKDKPELCHKVTRLITATTDHHQNIIDCLKVSPLQEKSTLEIVEFRNSKTPLHTSKWLVGHMIGGKRPMDVYNISLTDEYKKSYERVKRYPLGGVAIPLDDVTSQTSGLAFSFLPLPIQTNLRAHINAYFELATNRTSLIQHSDIKNDKVAITMADITSRRLEPVQMASIWNIILLEDTIVPIYLKTLNGAGSYITNIKQYYGLFPHDTENLHNFVKVFYQHLSLALNYDLFVEYNPKLLISESLEKSDLKWITLDNNTFAITPLDLKSIVVHKPPTPKDGESTPVTVSTKDIINMLHQDESKIAYITLPHILNSIYSLPKPQPGPDRYKAFNLDNVANFFKSKRSFSSLQDNPDNIITLLNYLSTSLNFFTKILPGLPLLLLQDGSVQCFGPAQSFGKPPKYYILFSNEKMKAFDHPEIFVDQRVSKILKRAGKIPETLGIKNLSWSDLVFDFILPDLESNQQTRTPSRFIEVLNYIAPHFGSFTAQKARDLGKVNIIPIRAGSVYKLLQPSQVYDPESKELEPFKRYLKFVPEDLCKPDILKMLRQLGIGTSLSAKDYYDLCIQLDADYRAHQSKESKEFTAKDLYDRAEALYTVIEKMYDELADEQNDQFMTLMIIPVKPSFNRPIALTSIERSVNSDVYSVTFKSADLRSQDIGIDSPSISSLVDKHILELFMAANCGMWTWADNDHFSEKNISHIDDVFKYCQRYNHALPAAIAERSLPLPGTSTLAEFNKIVLSATESYPPYFYALPERWRQYYSILGKIGAIKDLGVANIVKTINQLPTIIPETDMTSLVALFVRLVSTTGFDITTCGLNHLITDDGTLQPCEKVYRIGQVIEIDDINDIDRSKVFFIHPSLLELVGRLRLDDIHESVTFTLDRKESSFLSPPYPREFQTIISTIESPIFRESLQRIFIKAKMEDDDIQETLDQITQQFKIVPAHVATRITLKYTGEDITKNAVGSTHYFDQDTDKLYVDVDKGDVEYLVTETLLAEYGITDTIIVHLFTRELSQWRGYLDSKRYPTLDTDVPKEKQVWSMAYDGLAYSIDPVITCAEGDIVLLELVKGTEYVKAKVVREHHASLSELYYYTCEHSGTSYSSRLTSVELYIREVLSSSLPSNTKQHAMDRLKLYATLHQETLKIQTMIFDNQGLGVIPSGASFEGVYLWKAPTEATNNTTTPPNSSPQLQFYTVDKPQRGQGDRHTSGKYLEKAQEDFVEALHSRQPSRICFWAQQTVEKSLKSLLSLHGSPYDYRIHNVGSLYLSLPKEFMREDKIPRSVCTVGSYYIPTRYPSYSTRIYTQDEADEAREVAKLALTFVELEFECN
eukprot:gene7221-8386_t